MRYATAGAFRTALEQRLTARNQETGVPIVRLRKLVVFDRLLARLMNVAPDRWILKGAVALHFRVGLQFRTTRDIDLGRQDSEEEATADFIAAQSAELGDYFTLAIERTRQLDQAVEVFTVRYHVAAELAGRLFEDVTVDVGFGDPLSQDPELVCGPDLLSFAGIVPAEVPVLPLEEHIAGKLHAYSRRCAGGTPSTRVKDLVDLVMISASFGFQAGCLRHALENTFTSRDTHLLPTTLPSPPPGWATPYRRMADELGLDSDMSVGYEQARTFLDPVLAGTVSDSILWNPFYHEWQTDQ